MKTFIQSLIAMTAMAAGCAHAHYLWIEPGDTETRLFFGEPDVLLKEKSPGKLDGIKSPQAFTPDGHGKWKPVALARTADSFSIAGNKTATIAVKEESLEVRDLSKHGLGHAKSNYYARYGAPSGNAAAPLALDIQPTGPNGYTLTYRGAPLAGTKLQVIAPNTWTQEHSTDDKGIVRINTPWRGQYVIHVLHVDKTPGEFEGKQYESLRNHFTYFFVKADGADPGPAIPPNHPAE